MSWNRTKTEDTPVMRLSDGQATVKVRKVYTRNGQLLELSTPEGEESIRLDALELESLSWQEPVSLGERLLIREDSIPLHGNGDNDVQEVEEIRLSNEFAQAAITQITIDTQDLLRIDAPKLGYRIHLSPVLLAGLSRQNRGIFTEFLTTPYGSAEGH